MEMTNELVMISLGELFPHPNNPRKDLGDLTELSSSIKESGVLQNLTVIDGRYLTPDEWAEMEDGNKIMAERAGREYEPLEYDPHNPIGAGFTVIIGHRRAQAARLAGLTKVPCRIVDMDYKTQLATMMAENVQRTDLTPFEQANGFQMMMDLGMNVAEVSKQTGFSESTVRRRLKIAGLDADRISHGNYTLFDLERVAGINDFERQERLLALIGTDEFSREMRDAEKTQIRMEATTKAKTLIKEKAPSMEFVNAYTIGTSYSTYTQLLQTEQMDINEMAVPDIPKNATVAAVDISWDSAKVSFKFGMPRKDEEEKKKEATPAQTRNYEINVLRAQALMEINRRYEDRRMDFLKEVKPRVVLEHLSDVMHVIGEKAGVGMYDPQYNVLKEIFNLKGYPRDWESIFTESRDEAFSKEPERALLVYAYAKAAPEGASYFDRSKGKFAKHAGLDLAYEMLCACGYVLTDEEAEMKSGKGEMYEKARYAAQYDAQHQEASDE